MKLTVSVPIDAPKEDIWRVMTDFEHEAENLSHVNSVKIIENPNHSLDGLKWTETRTVLGDTETAEFCVIDFRKNSFFKTHSESHGRRRDATYSIQQEGDHNLLSVNYESRPYKLTARLSTILFGRLNKVTAKKSLIDDLNDIKLLVEHH